MPFSQRIKNEALNKSAFRCCICKDLASDIHHIVPQEFDGTDVLENAAPLCSSCHDYYGDNPDKIEKIRALRNHWWKMVEIKYSYSVADKTLMQFEGVGAEINDKVIMRSEEPVVLEHRMLENANFDLTSHMIISSLKSTQKKFPFRSRILVIEVEGHRNDKGGFDNDAYEIIFEFALVMILRYCSAIFTPLGGYTNPYPQWNNIPDDFSVSDSIIDKYNKRYDIK